MSLDYQQAVRARMQEAMQQVRVVQQKDPEIAVAWSTVESARATLARETDGAANPERDPRWVYWTQEQRGSVVQQWGERVETARQALATAEKTAQSVEGAWHRAQYQQKQDASKAAQQASLEQAQRTYALEQEEAAKTRCRNSWLAAGGLAEMFESAWPGIWQDELKKRLAGAPTMENRLRASGRYLQ